MKLRSVLLAATFVAAPAIAPVVAMAQPVTGWYIGAGLGYNILGNRKVENVSVGGVTTNIGDKFEFHNGFAGEGSIGYGFGDGFRVELEGDYYNNQVNNVSGNGGKFVASGNEKKYGAMVNALYDFDIGLPYLYPYVGAGVGVQFAQLNGVSAPGAGVYVNGTEGAFAYQGIAGIAFPIPSVPGLSVTAQYSYLGLAGSQKYDGSLTQAGVVSPATYKINNEGNNTIMLGLRYELFPPTPPAPVPVPTPAPVAAPAPAPARTYLVFFNWDKASLTPRATQIISEAAKASETTKVTRLNVNGYTDTSGSPAYNMKLSLRRAKNVAAKLVSDGVPTQDIMIKGYGETHLLVPTGPNVREPQNRRVEIILH